MLRGYAIQTVQPVDVDRVRPLIPAELEVVSLFPGKTIGGIYVSSYGTGSTLQYSELIIASAIVRYGSRLGAWISHIYVDNPASVAGGQEIWGLPKELAVFEWQPGKPHCVTVRQDDRMLCRLNTNWQLMIANLPLPKLPIPIAMGSFGLRDNNLLWFPANGNLQLEAIGATVEVPIASPFHNLNIDRPLLTLSAEQLNLTVNAPEVIGQRTSPYVYSA
jgi:hypothetical protein